MKRLLVLSAALCVLLTIGGQKAFAWGHPGVGVRGGGFNRGFHGGFTNVNVNVNAGFNRGFVGFNRGFHHVDFNRRFVGFNRGFYGYNRGFAGIGVDPGFGVAPPIYGGGCGNGFVGFNRGFVGGGCGSVGLGGYSSQVTSYQSTNTAFVQPDPIPVTSYVPVTTYIQPPPVAVQQTQTYMQPTVSTYQSFAGVAAGGCATGCGNGVRFGPRVGHY